MTKLIREDFTIVAFIKLDTKDEDIKTIKKEIESYDNIESVTYQTKKEVANEMKDTSSDLAGIIDSWSDDTNPLYNTFL